MAEPATISPARIEHGRWLYSAWKHLRLSATPETATSFEATVLAGKACDLLGRMRQLDDYPLEAVRLLARDARMSTRELKDTVIPVLEVLGIFRVDRGDDGACRIAAMVLSQDDVMDQVSRLWQHLDPDPVEAGAIVVLRATASLPLTREEAQLECSRHELTEEQAVQAIELALAVDLVRARHLPDFGEEFLYNDFLWGENIARTSEALAPLPHETRSSLRALIDELHEHEGRPASDIESASPDIIQLAITHGLIDATEITTAEGRKAVFHFTPRFLGFGVSREESADALDQVKLVIASFAFSTHFARYKLSDPERFLDSLIDRGYAGNASPIGTDYGAMERQKIVDVEPVSLDSSRYRFRSLKSDTLIEARDTMRSGALLVPNPRHSVGDVSLREPRSFRDPVATRRDVALRTGDRPIYDVALLAALREAAQQERIR